METGPAAPDRGDCRCTRITATYVFFSFVLRKALTGTIRWRAPRYSRRTGPDAARPVTWPPAARGRPPGRLGNDVNHLLSVAIRIMSTTCVHDADVRQTPRLLQSGRRTTPEDMAPGGGQQEELPRFRQVSAAVSLNWSVR